MIDDTNWVKLHRNLHGQFSPHKKRDMLIWLVYVRLLEMANWQDSDKLKSGQLTANVTDIVKSVALVSRQEVRTAIDTLAELGFIQTERTSKWKGDGVKITLLQYPVQGGEIIYNDPKLTINQPSTNHKLTINQPSTNHNNTFEELENIDDLRINQPSTNHKLTINQPSTNHPPQKNKELRTKKKKEDNTELILSESCALTPAKKDKTLGSRIWESYEAAFENSHQVKPARNAKQNKLCQMIGDRIGEDAIEVIKFYCSNPNAWYLTKLHSLSVALADIEKLQVEWKRGAYITSVDTREAELRAHNKKIIEDTLRQMEGVNDETVF